MMLKGNKYRLRLLSVSILWISLHSTSCNASDRSQVCTIDANGEETCEAAALEPGQTPSKELCLPDGHCYDSLATALSEKINDQTEGTYVELTNPVPFGEAQQVAGTDNAKTMHILAETYDYMVGVYKNDTTESFRDECLCRHEHCAFWASIGKWMPRISRLGGETFSSLRWGSADPQFPVRLYCAAPCLFKISDTPLSQHDLSSALYQGNVRRILHTVSILWSCVRKFYLFLSFWHIPVSPLPRSVIAMCPRLPNVSLLWKKQIFQTTERST